MVPSSDSEDEVYGLVYDLTRADEDALDRNEGVPFAYTQTTFTVDFWESRDGKGVDVSFQGTKKDVLVYIDRKRVLEDNPHEEYIHRINMGIKDAVNGAAVPLAYVQKVMRPFILEVPEQGNKEVKKLARKQASHFEDVK